MDEAGLFIVGANGQLGTALREKYPKAKFADVESLDISNRESVNNFDWSGVHTILNAAAYTNVDGAESAEGRVAAWKVNALAVGYLSQLAREKNLILVHISTDYVFDGTHKLHSEEELLSPLSVYGASKAAGDVAVSLAPKHYILRTSWVIGEGKNFVRTMLGLAQKGVSPSVVSDQVGRLTFTSELVRVIDHLLTKAAPFGAYNISNGGKPASWAEITRKIFELSGHRELTVTDTSTADYFKDKPEAAARPLHSTLDLAKIESTGFTPIDWEEDLKKYIAKEKAA